MKLHRFLQDIKKMCHTQSSGSQLQGQGHSSRSFIFSVQSCPIHNFLTTEGNSLKLHRFVQDIKKARCAQSFGSHLQDQGHSLGSFIFIMWWCPSHYFLTTERNSIKLHGYLQDIKKVCRVHSSGSQLQGQGHSWRLFIFSIHSCPSHNFLTTKGNTMKLQKDVARKVPDPSCKVKVTYF